MTSTGGYSAKDSTRPTPDNNTTTTSYTPAPARSRPRDGHRPDGPGHHDHLRPGRDLPLTVTGPAGYVSTEQYDSLGRLVAAGPRNPTGGQANKTFSYTVSDTAPSIVTTNTIKTGPTSPPNVSTTRSAGRSKRRSRPPTAAWMSLTPSTTPTAGRRPSPTRTTPPDTPCTNLVAAPGGSVPSQTQYTYDGAGRVTGQAATPRQGNVETDTSYGGDYTTVNPPAGGTARRPTPTGTARPVTSTSTTRPTRRLTPRTGHRIPERLLGLG